MKKRSGNHIFGLYVTAVCDRCGGNVPVSFQWELPGDMLEAIDFRSVASEGFRLAKMEHLKTGACHTVVEAATGLTPTERGSFILQYENQPLK